MSNKIAHMKQSQKSQPKTVFIASSTMVHENKKIEVICEVLQKNGFIARPWQGSLETDNNLLDELKKAASTVDFAIFYFAEDLRYVVNSPEKTKDKKTKYATSANVILEYGMFLMTLGPKRVSILLDGNTTVPSDLGGLLVSKIDYSPDNLRVKIEQIAHKWKDIPPRFDSYGISKPIIQYKNKLDAIVDEFTSHHRSKDIENHLLVNDQLLIDLYINALENVKKRFWTTTYLTSGFWAHGRRDVLKANVHMLERLRSTKSKDVRRLFLLREDERDLLKSLAKEVTDCRGRPNGMAQLDEIGKKLRRLRDICRQLSTLKCDIRFFYVNNKQYERSENIKEDTEVAFYDDFRIDFFDGGKEGKISGLRIFTDVHESFMMDKSDLEEDFLNMWNSAQPVDGLLLKMQRTFDYYATKIDYTFPKLLEFDSQIHIKDSKLKAEELSCLKKYLTVNKYFNTVRRYLDIGTCTGRYPFNLKQEFEKKKKKVSILGIDADPECIAYTNAKKKIEENNKPDNRILFQKSDFLVDDKDLSGKKFDLITCMLGTISHFGWEKPSKSKFKNDDLQMAIKKMKSLLSSNGLLVISNWTEIGLDSNMLEIYSETDRKNLRQFTEEDTKLKKRLEEFFSVETKTVNKRLKLYFCKNK